MKVKPHESPVFDILRDLNDVDEARRRLDTRTRSEPHAPLGILITRLDAVRNLHARLKEIAADVNDLADYLSMSLVPEAMQAAGFTTVNHSVGRVSISSRVSAAMIDKPGAMAWLREHDLGDLIIETVNAQTLSAQAKQMLEAGDELPAEHFRVKTSTYTSITHAGPQRTRKFRPEE